MRYAFAALLLAGSLGAAAFGQDGETVSVDARVIDYSSVLAMRGAGGHSGLQLDFPLRDAHVRLLLRGGGATESVETTTDGEGRLRTELRLPAPDTVVEFLVSPGDGASDDPGFYARAWDASSGPAPDEVRCYRVTTDPSTLWLALLSHRLTRSDDGSTAQLQTLAEVVNVDSEFRVFFAVDDPQTGQGSVQIPLPADFQPTSVRVDDRPVRPQVVTAPHGGRAFALTGTIFPSLPGSRQGTQVFLASTAPYDSARLYDFSFHPDVAVGNYVLTVEEASFHVTQPDETPVRVYDAGPQQASQGAGKPTRAFVNTEAIPPHADVAISVHGGAAFPVGAMVTVGVIVLIVVAGAFLGLALRRGEAGTSPAVEPGVAAPPPGSAAAELARLERRLARGEITSVEFQVRKRAFEARAAGAPAPRAPKDAPAAVEAVPADASPVEIVGAIEGRVGVASKEQLREDVHALARLVRELLDRA